MYEYQTERSKLFTAEGQRLFLKIRDQVFILLEHAGAVRMQEAIAGESSWEALACVDRLVELGRLREITERGVPGQYRVFVAGRGD